MQYSNLIFLPDRNTKKADFSGAFLPEAKLYRQYFSIPPQNVCQIDISKDFRERRKEVIDFIHKQAKEDTVIRSIAFFCHGLKNKIQLGFSTQTLHTLAEVMGQYCDEEVIVPIYACSTARNLNPTIADDMEPNTVGGDGGFADLLRDSLCANHMTYCRVMAHVTAGHTTTNPWVRFFDGDGNEEGGNGGYWVVEPKSELWKKWIKWLRTKDNRFRFPFMSYVDILDEVSKNG